MRTPLNEVRQVADKRNGRRASILPSIGDMSQFVGRMGRATARVGRKAEEENTEPDCFFAFLLSAPWIRTGVYKVTARTKAPTLIVQTGCYQAFLSGPSWIRTGVFGLSKPHGPSAYSNLKVFDHTWISTGTFEFTMPWGQADPSGKPIRLAA